MNAVEEFFYSKARDHYLATDGGWLNPDLDRAVKTFGVEEAMSQVEPKRRQLTITMLEMALAGAFLRDLNENVSNMPEVEREWTERARELFASTNLIFLRWSVAGAFVSIMDPCKQEMSKLGDGIPYISDLKEEAIVVPDSSPLSYLHERKAASQRGGCAGAAAAIIVVVATLLLA